MNAKCCKGEYFSSQILKAVAAVIKVNFITAGKLCKFTALCIYIQLPPTDFEWDRFMKSPTSCKIKTFSYLSCRSLQLLQSDNSQSVSVVGQSCLGMFAVVPYRLHHLKKWKMFKGPEFIFNAPLCLLHKYRGRQGMDRWKPRACVQVCVFVWICSKLALNKRLTCMSLAFYESTRQK